MKSTKRDLLVLSKKASIDKNELEHEVEKLNELLFHVESLENFCIANEVIDVNKYKVINDPLKIEKIISKSKVHPFQFINNKN